MLAILLREFGPPDRLRPVEVPEPRAKNGEVVIDVESANVTFVETQIRAGRPPHPAMLPRLPAVLGNGVGGIISAVGRGCDPALIGRRVISSLGGTGGYAQQVAVSAQAVIELPGELAVRDGLAVLADGRTALAAVRSIGLHRGETALVLAAGGGVGSLLVQLAKHAGARVIAAAGSDRKLALARSLGADLAVDYTEDGWADGVGSVDVVFDGVGGAIGRAAFAQLRPGGRVSVIGMASGAFSDIPEVDREARDVSIVRGVPQGPEASRALVREALGMLATGQLRPTIGQTLDLRDASEAHRAIEARETLGKTLLIAG